MKKNLRIILFSLNILVFASCSGVQTDPAADQYLSGLLESKNFFKLRSELVEAQSKLSEDRLLYYQMYCEQAFGDGLQSNKSAENRSMVIWGRM
jgi:hypothetical protein